MNSRPFLLQGARILLISSALFFAAVLPVSAQIVPCSGVACGLCDFLKLFQAIMRFLLLIAIPLASVLFAYAGFLYFSSAGDEGKLEKAKQIFIDVAIGFILALSAWLIIETILRATLNSTYFSGWNTIQCVEGGRPGASLNGQSSADTGTKSVTVGPNTIVPTGPQIGQGQLTHQDAYLRFTAAGIPVTSTAGMTGVRADCSGVTAGCTSLQGIREDTVVTMINLKQTCGAADCNFSIIGATEPGHTLAHTSGYKVDIPDAGPDVSAPSLLTSYIVKSFTREGTRTGDHGGPIYKDHCGNEYVYETNYKHWDVLVTVRCTP